jgi:tetratricopeptide (TPR) repeat protein
MSGRARAALWIAGIVLGGVAVWAVVAPRPSRPSPAPAPEPVVDAAVDDGPGLPYESRLAAADVLIEAHTARAAQAGSSWLARQMVAAAYIDRARLTGEYDDWIRAERWLEGAFEIAPDGGGPIMTRAELNYALHRFSLVEADLSRAENAVLVDDRERAEITARRGDLHFQAGRYAAALDAYRSAYDDDRTTGHALRLAHYHWKTAAFVEAEQYFAEAERLLSRPTHETRARIHVHRGLMDLSRARYEDALAHYRAADRVFDGYWLVEEHIAEADALAGRTDEAVRAYQDLVERTGAPELMEALARLLAESAPMEAADLARRAWRGFQARLAQLPEATYAHALEHCLHPTWGDPARAVELAEANAALRSGADARALLARAYAAADRLDDARRVVDELVVMAWSTAESHAIASEVYAAVGEPDRAAAERERAQAIRPDVFDL